MFIARVINYRPDEIVFTEKQMDQLYDLTVKCRNHFMSKEELIRELRGNASGDWIAAFKIIIAIITQEYRTLQNSKFDYIDESLSLTLCY
jgi:hypothetical protein